jgi:ABC-type maltose transport system permease subunit
MASNDQTGWRLRAIILLFIVISTIYLVNIFFVTGSNINTINQVPQIITDNASAINYQPDIWDYFTNIVFFNYIENAYILIFLNIVMASFWLAVAYISYTFVRDWIPFI